MVSGDSSLTEVVPRGILRAEGHFWWSPEGRRRFLVKSEGKKGFWGISEGRRRVPGDSSQQKVVSGGILRAEGGFQGNPEGRRES